MDRVIANLEKMQIKYNDIRLIREKDGVILYRIFFENSTYILKYFDNEEYRREIKNYEILKSLNIPTIKIISNTDVCLLMEDIESSNFYRLGLKEDMNDAGIAVKIAKWYKLFHGKGSTFISSNGDSFYDENNVITLENIALIKAKTETESNPVWIDIETNIDKIHSLIKKTKRTLTYNDFYYTNFIVAKDKSSAFMFDYNLLGKGYAYADIRNVCSSLGEEAKNAFLHEYDYYDKTEVTIDDVTSVIVNLYFACLQDTFPKWAEESLNELNNGFVKKVNTLLSYSK